MPPPRKPLIGVMGAGEGATATDCVLAEELGGAIARRGWALLSGGRPEGVMGAACAGAMAVEGHLVVGVLPDGGQRRHEPGATAPLDVALFTGLGQGRNMINALSSDVLVVCGAGGPGTASEAAHALKAGRPLVLLAAPPTWQNFFASLGPQVVACATVAEAMEAIERLLAKHQPPATATPTAPDSAQSQPTLPVALVQLAAGEDPGANRRQAEAWLERALQPAPGQARPRLLMLPEIWNAPYAAARFAAYAEPIPDLDPAGTAPGPDLTDSPSESLAMVARLARRHEVAVIAGSIPERGADGRFYNTATVIDPQGRLLAKHRKVHLFDVDVPGGICFRESDSLTGGSNLAVVPANGDPLATGLEQPPT
ncbi:MAG: nitrilase-related carbon-nitrogen hydrolase, partial [Cyanobacteriota bacterium]|nr:nitrilase-related carbon-nitrogen hydrolase [Cyanobacteriota bacterium]